jgi:aromatic ring-opening dioxygenase catalytic subunit (LigB family)
MKDAPPVLLLSHGTTLLTGEDSHIREYWLHHGNKAMEYGIKGIIIMVQAAQPHVLIPNS